METCHVSICDRSRSQTSTWWEIPTQTSGRNAIIYINTKTYIPILHKISTHFDFWLASGLCIIFSNLS